LDLQDWLHLTFHVTLSLSLVGLLITDPPLGRSAGGIPTLFNICNEARQASFLATNAFSIERKLQNFSESEMCCFVPPFSCIVKHNTSSLVLVMRRTTTFCETSRSPCHFAQENKSGQGKQI
jgi:hypothetical protein